MKLSQLLNPADVMAKLWSRVPTRVAFCSAVGLFIAIVYAVVAPVWYESTLTVVPASQSRGGFGGQISSSLGSALDLPGDLGGNAEVERIAAVFESRSLADAVIENFDLKSRYRESYIEQARKKLWSHCSTRVDRKAKLIALSCEDKDPAFAQRMLEYFGEYGNRIFRRVSSSSASEEVKFLERRVAEMRREADEAASHLREFEEKYKIIDLESQSKAVVSAMASLRSQEISKELQLSYMNTFSARDESSASQLRQQLAVMNSRFKRLEQNSASEDRPGVVSASGESRETNTNGADIFPPAMSVPKLRFELEKLARDRNIREAGLTLLMQRLEMTKVNEARDTSAFQILDYPVSATYPVRPRRILAMLAGTILGFLAGIAWAFRHGIAHFLNTPPGGHPT